MLLHDPWSSLAEEQAVRLTKFDRLSWLLYFGSLLGYCALVWFYPPFVWIGASVLLVLHVGLINWFDRRYDRLTSVTTTALTFLATGMGVLFGSILCILPEWNGAGYACGGP